jgi:hypothetical protein
MGKVRVANAKIEKSFRETPRPLKSLKTAKSGNFWDQRYQILSKTHDFAGEAISFRLASFSFRESSESPIRRSKALRAGGRRNLEKLTISISSVFRLVTP